MPPRAIKRSSSESKDSGVEQEAKIKPSLDDVAKLDSSLSDVVEMLKQRQKQYKGAALTAKRNGDIDSALGYVRTVKVNLSKLININVKCTCCITYFIFSYQLFDAFIIEVNKGASVDLSTIPPPLDDSSTGQDVNLCSKSPPELQKQESIKLTSSSADEDVSTVTEDAPSVPGNRFSFTWYWLLREIANESNITAPELYVVPKTILEALEQRLKKFQESEEAAKNENNDSKVRRMGRIVKQYKDAIKLHKAGKPIPVDELPTPPGTLLIFLLSLWFKFRECQILMIKVCCRICTYTSSRRFIITCCN